GFDSRQLAQWTGGSVPDVTLDSLEVDYRKSTFQIAVTFAAGGSRVRFVFLKAVGKGRSGFATGLELRLDRTVFSNGPLSNLVGDIHLGDLGIYYANEEFPEVRAGSAEPVQKPDRLRLPGADPRRSRRLTKGMNWSAKVSVGKLDLLDWPPDLPRKAT